MTNECTTLFFCFIVLGQHDCGMHNYILFCLVLLSYAKIIADGITIYKYIYIHTYIAIMTGGGWSRHQHGIARLGVPWIALTIAGQLRLGGAIKHNAYLYLFFFVVLMS